MSALDYPFLRHVFFHNTEFNSLPCQTVSVRHSLTFAMLKHVFCCALYFVVHEIFILIYFWANFQAIIDRENAFTTAFVY